MSYLCGAFFLERVVKKEGGQVFMTDRRQKVQKPRTTKTRLFFQTETKGKMCACVEPGVSFRFVGELTVTLRDKVKYGTVGVR